MRQSNISNLLTRARSGRNNPKVLKLAATLIVAVVLVFVIRQLFSTTSASPSSSYPINTSTRKQTAQVDQDFDIPIGTSDEVITFKVTNVDLTNEVILRGQKANAVTGRKFVILNIKLSNQQQQRVKIDSRDYVRLAVDDTGDRLAPSLHNDPIEVQPISDQFTKVGFTVDENVKSFKLYIGLIKEDKIEIPLDFN